ncbi:MAG: DNA repair protein RecN [Culicoidibacterales bacterium]
MSHGKPAIMLTQLHIENFAIIESLQIDFQEQMSVLTGETGAGKSIIIDAISILTGQRTSNEVIRFGANYAYIEGVFSLAIDHPASQILADNGIDADESLILSRRIGQNGKSICRANGKAITVNILRELGSLLIDIHSQHETQYLLQPKNHLRLLDQFIEFGEVQQAYRQAYRNYSAAKQALQQEQQRVVTKEQLDLYEYQLEELIAANIGEDEVERLEQQHREFAHADQIRATLTQSVAQLTSDEVALLPQLYQIKKQLESLQRFSNQYDSYIEQLTNVYYELDECATSLVHESQQFDNQAQILQEIEQRMSLIYQLQRKYGQDLGAYQQFLVQEIERIQNYDLYIQKLQQQLEQTRTIAQELADQMSALREQHSGHLAIAIEQQLKDLQMQHAQFVIEITPQELQANGQDQVEFLLTTNQGEPLRPLAKVASGGELSRIMLGMKVIFASNQPIQTMIFDEVDTGVSGAVAQAIALKMAMLAQDLQVFCITHLPQVAAISQHHLYVSKHLTQTHVRTAVESLLPEQRIQALAQMLAGEQLTETALQHARELLAATH